MAWHDDDTHAMARQTCETRQMVWPRRRLKLPAHATHATHVINAQRAIHGRHKKSMKRATCMNYVKYMTYMNMKYMTRFCILSKL